MVSSRKYLLSTLWADDVKKRDNKTCVLCGSTDNLQAHHIFGVQEHGYLCSEQSNGITLCFRCHKNYHDLYKEVNAYTWTQYVLNNQWNATSITINYDNGIKRDIEIFPKREQLLRHKDLLNGSLRNTVIHIIQTSGFDNGITPISWVELTVNQVYGVQISEIRKEIQSLIDRGLIKKIGKNNVQFKI